MAGPDPFDELGVGPGASGEEIQRAYRSRVVEQHRKGVFTIADHLRRAQRAFRALSDPSARETHLRERLLRESLGASDPPTARGRQLALLRSYKEQMSLQLERIGATNAAHHAPELAEIERQIAGEEAQWQELARRRRIAEVVFRALLLVLLSSAAVAVWIVLRGAP
jgi:curved DNA-binding protein CbpA